MVIFPLSNFIGGHLSYIHAGRAETYDSRNSVLCHQPYLLCHQPYHMGSPNSVHGILQSVFSRIFHQYQHGNISVVRTFIEALLAYHMHKTSIIIIRSINFKLIEQSIIFAIMFHIINPVDL